MSQCKFLTSYLFVYFLFLCDGVYGFRLREDIFVSDQEIVRIVKEGDTKRLRSLLNQGLSPNKKLSNLGIPLLIYAVADHNKKSVELLLEFKSDVNIPTNGGTTALMFVEDINIARLLVKAGANVNAANEKGNTPLRHAAISRNVPFAQLLVESGAEINTIDSEGKTPLMHAAITRDPTMVRFLLESGANRHIKDKSGFTAEMYADASGNKETASLLHENILPRKALIITAVLVGLVILFFYYQFRS